MPFEALMLFDVWSEVLSPPCLLDESALGPRNVLAPPDEREIQEEERDRKKQATTDA
jgi:hypothetical protein